MDQFRRPELSPILAKIPDQNGAAYREALAILRAAAGVQTTPVVIPLTSRRVRRIAGARYAYEHRAAIEAENLRAIRQAASSMTTIWKQQR